MTVRLPSRSGVEAAANSSALSAVRASPLANPTSVARASSSRCTLRFTQAALGIGQRAVDDPSDFFVRKLRQHEDARARKQRRVHLERWVFGRRADQRDRPVLDVRKHRVLLRFVEAMNLVDEQHRAAARAPARLRFGDDSAQVRDARADRRDALEVRARRTRDDFRERRLSGARRPPQYHRRHGVGFDRRGAARVPAQADRLGPTNSSSVRGRIRAASGIESRRLEERRLQGVGRRDRRGGCGGRRRSPGRPSRTPACVSGFLGILQRLRSREPAVQLTGELHGDVTLGVGFGGNGIVDDAVGVDLARPLHDADVALQERDRGSRR